MLMILDKQGRPLNKEPIPLTQLVPELSRLAAMYPEDQPFMVRDEIPEVGRA